MFSVSYAAIFNQGVTIRDETELLIRGKLSGDRIRKAESEARAALGSAEPAVAKAVRRSIRALPKIPEFLAPYEELLEVGYRVRSWGRTMRRA